MKLARALTHCVLIPRAFAAFPLIVHGSAHLSAFMCMNSSTCKKEKQNLTNVGWLSGLESEPQRIWKVEKHA